MFKKTILSFALCTVATLCYATNNNHATIFQQFEDAVHNPAPHDLKQLTLAIKQNYTTLHDFIDAYFQYKRAGSIADIQKRWGIADKNMQRALERCNDAQLKTEIIIFFPANTCDATKNKIRELLQTLFPQNTIITTEHGEPLNGSVLTGIEPENNIILFYFLEQFFTESALEQRATLYHEQQHILKKHSLVCPYIFNEIIATKLFNNGVCDMPINIFSEKVEILEQEFIQSSEFNALNTIHEIEADICAMLVSQEQADLIKHQFIDNVIESLGHKPQTPEISNGLELAQLRKKYINAVFQVMQ